MTTKPTEVARGYRETWNGRDVGAPVAFFTGTAFSPTLPLADTRDELGKGIASASRGRGDAFGKSIFVFQAIFLSNSKSAHRTNIYSRRRGTELNASNLRLIGIPDTRALLGRRLGVRALGNHTQINRNRARAVERICRRRNW